MRSPDASVFRRRRAGALLALGLVAAGLAIFLLGRGDDSEDRSARTARSTPAPTPTPAPSELPGGGRTIFPDRRVVSFYGHPAADELGILGIGKPSLAGRRLLRQVKPYERKTRAVLPAMELLGTIANADPGMDGTYRSRTSPKIIARYLKAAREVGALLVLDIQPGRADFFTETKALRRWLKEPDVGLALDPEWRVQEGQIPGKVIGSVTPRELNATTAWLDQLTERLKLPQKLVIVHQFTDDMVDATQMKARRNLAIVLTADGFGGREVKIAKYRAFTQEGTGFHEGFKLFYQEDVGLMTPKQVLGLRPPPDLVIYE